MKKKSLVFLMILALFAAVLGLAGCVNEKAEIAYKVEYDPALSEQTVAAYLEAGGLKEQEGFNFTDPAVVLVIGDNALKVKSAKTEREYSVTLTLTKIAKAYDIDDVIELVYTGRDQSLNLYFDNPENGAVTYSLNKFREVGVYDVTVTVAETDHYLPFTKDIKVKIADPADVSNEYDVVFAGAEFVYDGTEKKVELPSSELAKLPAGYTVKYFNNTATQAGEYTARAVITVNGSRFSVYAYYTIGKLDYDMSDVSFDDVTYVYDGTEKSIGITGELPAGLTAEYSIPYKATEAGVYTVTVRFENSDPSYNDVHDMVATLTISKADNVITAESEQRVYYTGERIGVTASMTSVEGVLNVVYKKGGQVIPASQVIDAGEYTVVLTCEATDNYNAAAEVTVSLVIVNDLYSYEESGDDVILTAYNGSAEELTIPAEWDGKKVVGIRTLLAHNPTAAASLRKVTIPGSIKTVGDGAFSGASSLTQIAATGNVEWETIGSYAFKDCLSLNVEFRLPSGIISVGAYAFDGSPFKIVYFPQTVTEVGVNCIDGNTEAYYAGSESVGLDFSSAKKAYYDVIDFGTSGGYRYVERAADAEIIEASADAINSRVASDDITINTLEIPETINGKNVTKIGAGALGVRNVNLIIFGTAGNGIGYISTHVTEIEEGAFAGASELEQIFVSFIGKNADAAGTEATLGYMFGRDAYEGAVTVNQNGVDYCIPAGLFNVVTTSTTIKDRAFAGIDSLRSFGFAGGVEPLSIGEGAFKNTGLEAIEIPSTVTTIGAEAFMGCEALTSAVFQEGSRLTKLERSVFQSCTSLKNIDIPDNVTEICNGAFSNASSLETAGIPSGLIRIGDNAFDGNRALTNVVIPKSVTYVGAFAFRNCDNVTINVEAEKVDFDSAAAANWVGKNTTVYYGASADNVVTYSDHKFMYVTLNSASEIMITKYLGYTGTDEAQRYNVAIPEEITVTIETIETALPVTVIGVSAFAGTGVTKLTVPRSIKEIKEGALRGMAELYDITLPFIGASADATEEKALFGYVFGRTSYVGGSIAEQYYYKTLGVSGADYKATYYVPSKLQVITLIEGVTNVADYAFQNCGAIASVWLPKSVTRVGKGAVSGCGSLTVYFEAAESELAGVLDSGWNPVDRPVYYGTSVILTTSETSSAAGLQYYVDGNNAVITRYIGRDVNVVIPDTISVGKAGEEIIYYVNKIGKYAFSGSNIVNVTVSKEVTAIDDYAFANSKLASIGLAADSKLKTIGAGAFSGSRLTSITIPVSVISIGRGAFENCVALAAVTFADGSALGEIADNTFNGCSSLDNVVLPAGILSIGVRSFAGTASTSFTFNEGLETIGGYAFYGSRMASAAIPARVTSIGEYAFAETVLGALTFADATVLQTIGNYAFNNAAPAVNGEFAIALPSSVTSIGEGAFKGSGVTAFTFADIASAKLTYIDKDAFNGAALAGAVELPSSLVTIGDGAFADTVITAITFADNGNIAAIGAGAFSNTAITSLDIPSTVTAAGADILKGTPLESISIYFTGANRADSVNAKLGYYFGGEVPQTLVSVTVNGDVKNGAFGGLAQITEVVLNGTVSIGDGAFKGTSITKVEIPNTVTSIGNEAFADANIGSVNFTAGNDAAALTLGNGVFSGAKVTSAAIPSRVISIGSGIFAGCVNLTELTIPFVGRAANATAGDAIFGYLFGTQNVAGTVEVTQTKYSTVNGVYYIPASLRKVTVGGEIKDNAFMNCSMLVNVDFTANTIGNGAFSGCSGLTGVTFSSNVISIGDNAFTGCIALETVDFSGANNLSTIGAGAFLHCKNLKIAELPDSLQSIGAGAFGGCVALETIKVPFIGAKAVGNVNEERFFAYIFSESASETLKEDAVSVSRPNDKPSLINISKTYYVPKTLKTIVLGNNIKNIDSYAFYGIQEAGTLNVDLTNVENIGNYAFAKTGLTAANFGSGIKNIGDFAFAQTAALATVTFDAGATDVIICANAFTTSSGVLNAVTLPQGVTIGLDAFKGAERLTTLSFADGSGSTVIREGAFGGCTSLASIEIKNSMTLDTGAFENCTALTYIRISGGVIGEGAFRGCNAVERVSMAFVGGRADAAEAANKAVGYDGAGSDGSRTDTLTEDGKLALSSDHRASVFGYIFGRSSTGKTYAANQDYTTLTRNRTVGADSVTSTYTFGTATATYDIPVSLISVSVDDGADIPAYAFMNMYSYNGGAPYGLRETVFGSGITIGDKAFYGDKVLSAVNNGNTIDAANIGEYAFAVEFGEEKEVGAISAVDFGSSVRTIGKGAFRLSAITQLVIPETVEEVGYEAFAGTHKLESVTMPFAGRMRAEDLDVRMNTANGSYVDDKVGGSVTIHTYDQISRHQTTFGYIFGEEASAYNYTYTDTAGASHEVVNNIAAVQNFDIVQKVEERLNDNLPDVRTQIKIIETKTINYYVPASLKSVNIVYNGAESRYIDKYAFMGYNGLTDIKISGNFTEIKDRAFYNTDSLVNIDLSESKIETIGEEAFAFDDITAADTSLSSLTSITMPSTLKSIGNRAFRNSVKLSNIVLNEGLESIGDGAFTASNIAVTSASGAVTEQKMSYTTVEIPSTVNYIGDGAFAYNDALSTVTFAANGGLPLAAERAANGLTVGNNAFRNNRAITSIDLPANTVAIGDYAFYDTDLTGADLSATSVESIGSYAYSFSDKALAALADFKTSPTLRAMGKGAFSNNPSLTSFVFAQGITALKTISQDAFRDNTAMADITTLPDSLESIEGGAFVNCVAFADVKIPSNVKTIAGGVFAGCGNIRSLNVPFVGGDGRIGANVSSDARVLGYMFGTAPFDGANKVLQGGEGSAYYYIPQSLTSVEITSAEMIGEYALYSCSQITEVILHEGVRKIASNAFAGGKWNNVIHSGIDVQTFTIPSTVTEIGGYAFAESKITDITFPANSQLETIGENVFRNCKLNGITIPASVKEIGNGAFYGTTMTQLVIPDNVMVIGEGILADNNKLTSLTVPFIGKGQVRNADGSYSPATGYGTNLAYLFASEWINNRTGIQVIKQNSETRTVNRDGSVTVAYDGELSYSMPTSLVKVTVRNSYAQGVDIGAGAFQNMEWLTEVAIESKVNRIGGYAFYNAKKFGATFDIPSDVTEIGERAFYGTSVNSLTIPSAVKGIANETFAYSKLSTINFLEPTFDGTAVIGARAFMNCGQLTAVSVPSKYSAISEKAFEDCGLLSSLTIGGDVAEIGVNAFANAAITGAEIPSSVVNIASGAFANNAAMASLVLHSGLQTIGERAFSGISAANIILPRSVIELGAYSFDNNSMLKQIEFEQNVTGITHTMTIGDGAFAVSDAADSVLDNVYLPDNVYKVGTNAFGNHTDAIIYVEAYQYTADTRPAGYEWSGSWKDANAIAYYGVERYGNIDGIEYAAISVKEDRSLDYAVVTKLRSGTAVTVADTVTIYGKNYAVKQIGLRSFENALGVTSVTLPSTIYSISEKAFYGAKDLTSITIADGVKNISALAFAGTSITELAIPDSVLTIGERALAYNPMLGKLTLPFVGASRGDARTFAAYFFAKERRIDSPEMYQAVKVEGSTVLEYYYVPKSLTDITIRDNAATAQTNTIADSAFSGLKYIENVVIGGNVTSIGIKAFKNTTGLTSIDLGSVETIGDSAFDTGDETTTVNGKIYAQYVSSLTTLNIPASVTHIGNKAFKNASALTGVTFADGTADLTIGSEAFSMPYYAGSVYVSDTQVLVDKIRRFDLPSRTYVVGDSVFENRSRTLQEVNFVSDAAHPSKTQTIGADIFKSVNTLTSITVPFIGNTRNDAVEPFGYWFGDTGNAYSVTMWQSNGQRYSIPITLRNITVTDAAVIGSGAFGIQESSEVNTSIKEITLTSTVLTDIKANAFSGLGGLTYVSIPSSVKTIGDKAFYRTNALTQVDIPTDSELETIGESAFAYAYVKDVAAAAPKMGGLTSFFLPAGLKSIGARAFAYQSLTDVTVPDSVETVGAGAYAGNASIASITLPFIGGAAGSPTLGKEQESLFGYIFSSASDNYGAVAIDKSIRQISVKAGTNTPSAVNYYVPAALKTITLSDKALTINAGALSGLNDVTVNIGAGVKVIGDYAFNGTKFTGDTVTIPQSVAIIGDSVFGMTNLTGITVEAGSMLEYIGDNAFANTAIAAFPFDVTDRLAYIGNSAFADTAVRSVALPAAVKEIGSLAFYGLDGLELTFAAQGALEVIGANAFADSFATKADAASIQIDLPEGVKEIGNGAFSVSVEPDSQARVLDGVISGVTFPSTLERIGTDAFKGQKKITSVSFASGSVIEYIGDGAFVDAVGLTSIALPASIKHFSRNIFGTGVTIAIGYVFAEGWSKEGWDSGISASFNSETLTTHTAGGMTYALVDDKAYPIALTGETALTIDETLTIPGTVTDTTVTEDRIYKVVCTELFSLTSTVNAADVISENYNRLKAVTELTVNARSVKSNGFSGMTGLQRLTLGDKVKAIETGAFKNSKALSLISGGANIEYVAADAFGDGKNADGTYLNVVNQSSYKKTSIAYLLVGDKAFVLNVSLQEGTQTISIPASIDGHKVIGIVEGALPKTGYDIAEIAMETIGANTFKGTPLANVVLDGVKRIEDGAFANCTALESIDLEGVEYIGDGAFRGCTALTEVVMNSVKYIGKEAFIGSTALIKVTIGSAAVDSIGARAFDRCSRATIVTFTVMTAAPANAQAMWDIGVNIVYAAV